MRRIACLLPGDRYGLERAVLGNADALTRSAAAARVELDWCASIH